MKNNPNRLYGRFAATFAAARADHLPGRARCDAGLSAIDADGGRGFRWPANGRTRDRGRRATAEAAS